MTSLRPSLDLEAFVQPILRCGRVGQQARVTADGCTGGALVPEQLGPSKGAENSWIRRTRPRHLHYVSDLLEDFDESFFASDALNART